MVTDLLFLRRFFDDDDPWRSLRPVRVSTLEDFAPARRLGYRLYMRDDV